MSGRGVQQIGREPEKAFLADSMRTLSLPNSIQILVKAGMPGFPSNQGTGMNVITTHRGQAYVRLKYFTAL